MADKEQLGLALDALLENAVKFTSADDVIALSVEGNGPGEVRLGVSDTGSGIAVSELPHVFDRFRTSGGVRGIARDRPRARAGPRRGRGARRVRRGPQHPGRGRQRFRNGAAGDRAADAWATRSP